MRGAAGWTEALYGPWLMSTMFCVWLVAAAGVVVGGGLPAPSPGPLQPHLQQLEPTRQPPREWMAAIAQSDKLWAFNESAVPKVGRYHESVLPLLGNGMVGWQIGEPNLYVSGVFNGQSTAGINRATQRAAVPAGLAACAVDPPGSIDSDTALDLREAILAVDLCPEHLHHHGIVREWMVNTMCEFIVDTILNLLDDHLIHDLAA